MTKEITIRIGTRGSKLAIIQTELVISAVKRFAKKANLKINYQIIPIKTVGDKITNIPLYDIGGKALFTKDIDQAVLQGKIDIAVHSLKDCEAFINEQLEIITINPRADYREVLINNGYKSLLELEKNSILGTCSPRRTSQVLHLRSDLKIESLRGNVPTRLSKTKENIVDSTLLAIAGLQRLNIDYSKYNIIPENVITPAVGQGYIGVLYKKNNSIVKEILYAIANRNDNFCLKLERFFLQSINGNCRTPVGGLVTNIDKKIKFLGCVASLDGKFLWREEVTIKKENAESEIKKLGREMKNWLKKHC